MRASSGCRAHRWRSMTSRTPLKEVKPSFHRNLDYLAFLFSTVLSSSSSDVIFHLSLGEDPLAGDQNDHDMDSIAGVLKLYFRGLDQALFPKEVFHDLISCVCKFLILLPSLHVCVCVCICVKWVITLGVCSSDGEPPGAGRSHQKGPPVSAKQNPHHHEIPVCLPPPVSHTAPQYTGGSLNKVVKKWPSEEKSGIALDVCGRSVPQCLIKTNLGRAKDEWSENIFSAEESLHCWSLFSFKSLNATQLWLNAFLQRPNWYI